MINKRGVISGIFIILLIGIVSATPYILFVSPTPANEAQTTGSSLTINSTIENIATLNEFIFNWQGTNYSLYDEDLILMLNLNNNSALGENNSHVYDSSRGGHNGSVLGGAEYITSGKYAGAYNFTGGSGINISASSDFGINEYTTSLWIKTKKKNIINFSIGSSHTCYVDESYTGYCVGDNTYGQLGTSSTMSKSEVPIKIENYNFKQIAASMYSSCGLLLNGSVMCWGDNGYGQLGLGGSNSTDMHFPVYLTGGWNFSRLIGSHKRTCGYLYNDSLMCWGDGNHGEYGDGVSGNRYTPTLVTPSYNFSKISVAEDHMCGLYENGTLLCWGGNYEYQLGDNTSINRNVPGPVFGNYLFQDVGGGEDQTCAVLTNGSMTCWGENQEGQIGDGTLGSPGKIVPTFSDTPFLFKEIYPSKHIQCGKLINDSYACWGIPGFSISTYGDGTNDVSRTPKLVNWDFEFERIELGNWNDDTICGQYNKSIYCWGYSSKGGKGLGYSEIIATFPIKLNLGEILDGEDYVPYFTMESSCVLKSTGELFCMGINKNGILGDNTTNNRFSSSSIYGDYNFSAIYPGYYNICGKLQNGSTLCWGKNNYGQLGDNTSTQRNKPIFVYGNYNFSSVSPSNTHACGLLQNGSVLCWGNNNYGQLGNGSLGGQGNIPIYVSGGHNFSSVYSGNVHACGLLYNGSALCWGRNNYNQLGNGSSGGQSNIPIYVSGGYNFSSIISRSLINCGLLYNGSGLCWGFNLYGGLGIGNTTQMMIPIYVSGGHNFSSIKLGLYTPCGVLENGSLLCWGWNLYGQLADGTTTNSLTPKIVLGNYDFTEFLAYNYNSCVKKDGGYYCWGSNTNGQLGTSLPIINVPQNFYQGELFSQSSNSFKIGLTLNNTLRIIFYNKYFDYPLGEEDYSNIILSSNGTQMNLYLNGNNIVSENFFALSNTLLEDIIIGKSSSGEIDEILMWNRTLTASEIEQVYLSSLKQKNHTAWEFYSTQTLSSVGTYSYTLFALDSTGSFSVLRRIIKYVVEVVQESFTGSPSITVTETKLQEGQTRQLRQGAKVKLEFSGQGSKVLEIISVDKENNVVKVDVNGVEVEIINGTTEKIDVNSDGFYDLEVSVQDISSTGSARLKFKEIYEAVESDVEEGVEEEVKEEGESTELDEEGERRVWVYFVIGGIVLIGFIVFFSLWRKKK